MKKETVNLYLNISQKLKEEREYLLSLNKETFLEQFKKQRIINGSNKIAVFAAKDYRPNFTEKEKRMFIYMLDNNVFDKFIFNKNRPKKEYKIILGKNINQFIVRDRYAGGCNCINYFITK